MSHNNRLQQVLQHLQPNNAAGSKASSNVYDVIIVGTGAMGVSSAYHLAKGGKKVLALERYTVAHANGSSHGETRITRLAYWEHPNYVPLLRRSFELFSELESASGQKLFEQTGSMDIGPESEATFAGSKLSCELHNLPHEILTPAQLAERYPAWRVPSHYRACFQPAGGMLFPEKVVAATAALARKHGAIIQENTEVVDIEVLQNGTVAVKTAKGETFHAHRIILSAGAWLPTLLQKSSIGSMSPRLMKLSSMLRPERQVVTWYSPKQGKDAVFQSKKHPVWVATFEGSHYYGFPLLEHGSPGVKIGRYHHAYEELGSENALNDLKTRQNTTKQDQEFTDEFMRNIFGTAIDTEKPALKMSTCIFTNTPDEHFIIDPMPDKALPQISFISACSGHGFKFSSVLGEIMAGFILTSPEEVEKKLPVAWLDAGRLLGDKPPMQVLDPHLAMKEKKL